MADFKSDVIDATSSYNYLPTGAVIMIAGSYSKYSDSTYTNLGLIPCDGRFLDGTTSAYINLYKAIGTTYGGTGQSSFAVPALTTVKKAIIGKADAAPLGGTTNTSSHSHTPSVSYTYNNADETHSHAYSAGFDWNVIGVNAFNYHRHNFAAHSATIGTNTNASNYSTAGPGNQTALVPGSHNHGVNFNAHNTDDVGANAHNHTASGNSGNNTTTTTHTHSASATATFPTKTFDGTNTNPLEVPYANVLYFIRI